MARTIGVVAGLLIGLLASPASAGPIDAVGGPSAGEGSAQVVLLADLPYTVPADQYQTVPVSQYQTLDAYLPVDGQTIHPAVVLIHGGRWEHGSKAWMAPEARYLAQHGFAAFSINYRLAPDYPWPAQLEDAQMAVAWIRANAAVLGVDATRVGAFGTSAGGQIAAMLGTLTDGMPTTGWGVLSAAAWSGPMDLPLIADLRGYPYLDAAGVFSCSTTRECERVLRDASPITYVGTGDATLFFVHSRDDDLPVRSSEAMDGKMDRLHLPHTYLELRGDAHGLECKEVEVPGEPYDVIEATLAFFEETLAASPAA